MQKLFSLCAATTFIAGSALSVSAQDYSDNTPTRAASASQSNPDWTGFYGGIQLGYGDIDTDESRDNDGIIGGITGGYDYDLGNWVIGASVDYDFADLDISGSTDSIEEIFRAKLRGGYKIDRGLIYATAGYANAQFDNSGNDDGYFFGGGYDYLVSDHFSIGTEILYHRFNNVSRSSTGFFGINLTNSSDSIEDDVEVITIQIRGAIRF